MLDKQQLQTVVEDALSATSCFLVSVTVSDDNNVAVTIDSPEGVDLDTCVAVTRAVEAAFDRDAEDYELTVGSAGVTTPFSVPQQYHMNVGNPVTVITRDGRKLHGTLAEVREDLTVVVEVPTKVKEPGAKRPVVKGVPEVLAPDNVKSIVREI